MPGFPIERRRVCADCVDIHTYTHYVVEDSGFCSVHSTMEASSVGVVASPFLSPAFPEFNKCTPPTQYKSVANTCAQVVYPPLKPIQGNTTIHHCFSKEELLNINVVGTPFFFWYKYISCRLGQLKWLTLNNCKLRAISGPLLLFCIPFFFSCTVVCGISFVCVFYSK